MPTVYSADRIFTGEQWLYDHAVIVQGDKIEQLIPVSQLTALQSAIHFHDCFIAPAFIDLQVYGAYGKLLAAFPETDSLQKLKEYCEKGGAALCLPTIATNTREVFFQCIDAVRDYWNKGGEGILGLHLEGPWINSLKRGAHVKKLIHPPELAEVEELLRYGKDVIKMITLAPEICNREIIDFIRSNGVIISAGHSNATYSEANTGFDNGITAVTHLFNAMSPLHHRNPGLVGATMDYSRVMASIIPDGHHVDYAAIRIAKQVMKERLFVITDAVTETTSGYYQHSLEGDKYLADDILSGSALTMVKALQNLVNFAQLDLGEVLRMCSLYPARVMGMNDYGKIEKGAAAKLVVMSNGLEVKQLL